MDPNSNTPIVVLKGVESEAVLPIWVGAYEANAIALEIEKIVPQRPMTHDLLRNLIIQMGYRVERVIVTDLRDNTFYAVIDLVDEDGEKVSLDARPSDAIALALRTDSPIYVDQRVLDLSSANIVEEKEEAPSEEEWPDVIE